MARRKVILVTLLAVLAVVGVVRRDLVTRLAVRVYRSWRGGKTVAQRIAEHGPSVRERLAPAFVAAGLPYPPARIVLATFKEERRLELHAAGVGGPLRLVKTYPVRAASGNLGPKLREGDRQVPEGTYAIESLNPNSLFHLSLRLAYPSAFDRAMAARDDRTKLGGDIMIHGGASSVGCVAIGDEGIEEVFVLAAMVGVGNVTAIIAPVDFRTRDMPVGRGGLPAWTAELYAELRAAVQALPDR